MKGCSEFSENTEDNDPNDIDYNDSYASRGDDVSTWMNISFPTDEQEDDDDEEAVNNHDNDGEEMTPVNVDFYLYVLCDETIMKVHK
jgi:hypothetical protein